MLDLNERLAEAVKQQMRSAGLTQVMVSSRGGPSSTTLTKITSGEGVIQPAQLTKLDRGLGWEPGRALRILNGTHEEPEPEPLSLEDVSDDALVAEVLRRMKRGGNDAGDAEAQKSPDDDGPLAPVLPMTGREVAGHKRQRVVDDAQEVTSAAYEDKEELSDEDFD